MSDKRIKVIGYGQKVTTSNGIEYRNFSDALVGNQLTSDGGTTLFTLGNFRVTTNLEPKANKFYKTSQFSKFYNLNGLTDGGNTEIFTDKGVVLNLDKSDITNYAYFGSLKEYIRVSLENIIQTWPASLYVNNINQEVPSSPKLTYENVVYDDLTNTTTFDVKNGSIKNDFVINLKESGNILKTFNQENKLRDLNISFNSYELSINEVSYPIIDFTGFGVDEYLHFKVKGQPFTNPSGSDVNYHIKPSQQQINKFYLGLNDFEGYLLNRNTNFKAEFKFNLEDDNGNTILSKKTVKWPVSDGYNIDFQSERYLDYTTKLLDIASTNDANKSNIISNRMVSESIFEFDTVDQKMNKTLKIYGRSFDEIKRNSTGIKFANTVTYDKENNIPDSLVKNLARTLGWELTTSLFNINFNDDFLTSKGELNLSPVQSEIEFWRRLIINSPWVWKSKGTRKVVEFLLRFVGTPAGLVTFNEYVYKASNLVDTEELKTIFELNGLEYDEDTIAVDADGYPRVLKNNNNLYFQKGGLWYRQTAGENSNIDKLTGNNPHIGPYDAGYEYVNQFNSLIPNFTPVTITNTNTYSTIDKTYENYDYGKFDKSYGVETNTFIEVLSRSNNDVDDCFTVNSEIIENPKPNPKYESDGILIETEGTQASYKISILKKNLTYENPCNYVSFLLDSNGLILFTHNDNTQDYNITSECCSGLGFASELDTMGRTVCRWQEVATNPCDNFQSTSTFDNSGYMIYTNLETGEITTIVPTTECCTNDNYTFVSNGDGYSCMEVVATPEPNCDDYIFTGNYDGDYAVFQFEGGTTNTVLSSECCTTNGLEPTVINGGVRCIEAAPICESYTIAKITTDGYVVFKDTNGILQSTVDSVECCEYHNPEFEGELQNDGSVKCRETQIVSELPILSLINREPSQDCSLMTMTVEGTPNTVVKYRITTMMQSNHGFINEVINTDTGEVITPSTPASAVGSYCEGSIRIPTSGIVNLTMDTCTRPSLEPVIINCVELEFAIFDYDNTNIKNNNKLSNRACD